MQRFKIIIPLMIVSMFVVAYASETIVVTNNNPESIPRFTGTFGQNLSDTSLTNLAVMIDSVGALGDAIWAYDSLQITGAKLIVTSGNGLGQVRYISEWRDTTATTDATLGSLYVTPAWDTTVTGLYLCPDSGDTYTVIWNWDDGSDLEDKWVKWSGNLAFDVTYGDTIYSDPIKYNEHKYGDRYSFIYSITLDTTTAYGVDTCDGDSADVFAYYEISHDLINWSIPNGDSGIFDNVTGYIEESFSVTLPVGTDYFRIGVSGNAGNTVHPGVVWVKGYVSIPEARQF